MSNRSATDTIKGYFYQFDYSICQLLNLPLNTDQITVEGIEDVDIESLSSTTAVQCKYYSKTEYNHSVIAKPIRLMLSNFAELKNNNSPVVQYHLYGHYKSGQNKLTLPIDLIFLKDKLLTYRSGGTQKQHHIELGITDSELEEFMDLLSIDVSATDYSSQFQNIISSLSEIFSCDSFDAEYCFYNNALNEIRRIAIESDIVKRTITKGEFLDRINQKQILFNKWFLELKGRRKYHKELKDKHFRTLNKAPYERFFIIELADNTSISSLKDLVFIISRRYSNLKKREPQTFCPYIHFKNLTASVLTQLKQELYAEGFNFIDGFPFSGSEFSKEFITKKADFNNKISAKLLDDIDYVNETLSFITRTREIYQFYFNQPLFVPTLHVKCVNIQIHNTEDIKEII